jgi:hypothetical protein
MQVTKNIQSAPHSMRPYSLVAFPDAFVTQKIRIERELFGQVYKQQEHIASKPGITIATFFAFEAMEETLLRYIQRVCSSLECFEVMLNNYSGFPFHSLYLRVQNPEAFKKIGKGLKVIQDYLISCSCPPLNVINNPRLSLAEGLTEEIYLQVMFDYSQKTFHESFKVDQIVMKSKNNQYESAKTINVFPLRPVESLLSTNIMNHH